MTQPDGWDERGFAVGAALLGGEWTVERLHGTGGGEYGSAVARLRRAEHTAIVKVVRRNEAGSSDPSSWRRELDAYRSTWLNERLGADLAVPRLLQSAETDEAAVMVLADVAFDDIDARSVEWYGRLALGLGALAGGRNDDIPAWASLDFISSEVAGLASDVPTMASTRSPHVDDVITLWLPILERLVDVHGQAVARLADGPSGFAHLDAFSRNAAEVGGGLVLIDWAYAGMAPLGADAAGVIAMTAMHGDIPGAELSSLRRAVVDGYTAGITLVRSDIGLDALHSAIDLMLVLRWCKFLSQIRAVGDDIVQIAENVSGRHFDSITSEWMAASEFLMPIADTVCRDLVC